MVTTDVSGRTDIGSLAGALESSPGFDKGHFSQVSVRLLRDGQGYDVLVRAVKLVEGHHFIELARPHWAHVSMSIPATFRDAQFVERVKATAREPLNVALRTASLTRGRADGTSVTSGVTSRAVALTGLSMAPLELLRPERVVLDDNP